MSYRTYRHKHKANKKKLNKVKDMLLPWRKFAIDIAKVQWNLFFATGSFSKFLDNLHHIPSELTEREKQSCRDQVVSVTTVA
jgi:hypothetical protein